MGWVYPKESFPLAEQTIKLKSKWETAKDPVTGKMYFSLPPTIAEHTTTVSFAILSGATIMQSQIWGIFETGTTGSSILTVNGNTFDEEPWWDAEAGKHQWGANIRVNKLAGTMDITFTWKANGNLSLEAGAYEEEAVITKPYLWIYYWAAEGAEVAKPQNYAGKVFVPPQSVALYVRSKGNPLDGAVYLFDGVTNIQHNASLKIEEDPDEKKKNDYINNAKPEPDKIVLDVVMSDVYTDPEWTWTSYLTQDLRNMSALQNEAWEFTTRTPWTRSAKTYRNLHYLCSSRIPICVVTPQFVYTNMLLTSVSINQEENNPNGWSGQLTFETITTTTKKKATNAAQQANTSVAVPTPSNWFQMGIDT